MKQYPVIRQIVYIESLLNYEHTYKTYLTVHVQNITLFIFRRLVINYILQLI